MTVEHPMGDEVTQLARRVEKARGRMAFQFDPSLTEALSEDELKAERELAERIREQEREQRWKNVQAAASASDRARQTSEEIAKADMRDLLMARKAIAAQRRESSPHAKLASLYRHRAWSQRALAGVVMAGMLWSAVNVQHNIAPGGPTDPLYWFSYLLEAMISVCLVIIMIGTNKVSEWGILESRRQIVVAELALLALTVGLNTYPYLRSGSWYDVGVHAVAPIMVGVALLVHDSASNRYGQAIARATDQVQDLPDPAEQIRRTLPTFVSFIRQAAPDTRPSTPLPALPTAPGEQPQQQQQQQAAAEPGKADVRDAETVDPMVEPDIWLPKSSSSADNSSAKSWMSDLKDAPKTGGKKAKPSAEAEADDPSNLYDTGQFRIAETLEQELAELRAERRRARAKKQQRAGATNGAGDDE
ncbi:hypothetical protein ACFYTQ_34025 [Nocardia sp. NPDC004068]|uniref:hypothetical protein n=1 Tax=Nocardia sp. NPDC004068 TaxID=3364303 RepID=UPI0036755593